MCWKMRISCLYKYIITKNPILSGKVMLTGAGTGAETETGTGAGAGRGEGVRGGGKI